MITHTVKLLFSQGRQNGFQSGWVGGGAGGAWNTEKYSWPPWLANKKNFRILDTLEWLKQKYFDLGDSHLIVSALKPFLFCLYLPFFFLLRQKVPPVAGPVNAIIIYISVIFTCLIT